MMLKTMKILCGCLLLLSGACIWSREVTMSSYAGSTSNLSNVALGGYATQSASSYTEHYASRSIDGNKNTDFNDKFCSTTDYADSPWWRVDLLNMYEISSVVITNRGDCCTQRIIGAEIRIGNSLDNNGNNNPRCADISSMPATLTITNACKMIGRYVNVVIPETNRILTLCEVEVYGVPITKKENLRIKFHTTENMTDSTARDKALQQLKTALAKKGVSAVQLYWTRQPKLELKNKGDSKLCDVN
ncbi:hypothetical protein AOLI_G00191080 [Acnodon oligacanthus]